MTEYTINVSEIEELQMTNNISELEQMFTRAHRAVVQGGAAVLVRKNVDGSFYKFDELTTEEDLQNYKDSVFKYL